MHDRCAVRRIFITRPLKAAHLAYFIKADPGKCGGQPGYFIHDLGRIVIGHLITHGPCKAASYFPFIEASQRLHSFINHADAPFRVGEGAVLFQKAGAGQKYMGKAGGLVQE